LIEKKRLTSRRKREKKKILDTYTYQTMKTWKDIPPQLLYDVQNWNLSKPKKNKKITTPFLWVEKKFCLFV